MTYTCESDRHFNEAAESLGKMLKALRDEGHCDVQIQETIHDITSALFKIVRELDEDES